MRGVECGGYGREGDAPWIVVPLPADGAEATRKESPRREPKDWQEQLRLSSPTAKQVDYLLRLLLEKGETTENAKAKIQQIRTKAEASLAINRLRAGLKLLEQ